MLRFRALGTARPVRESFERKRSPSDSGIWMLDVGLVLDVGIGVLVRVWYRSLRVMVRVARRKTPWALSPPSIGLTLPLRQLSDVFEASDESGVRPGAKVGLRACNTRAVSSASKPLTSDSPWEDAAVD